MTHPKCVMRAMPFRPFSLNSMCSGYWFVERCLFGLSHSTFTPLLPPSLSLAVLTVRTPEEGHDIPPYCPYRCPLLYSLSVSLRRDTTFLLTVPLLSTIALIDLTPEEGHLMCSA